MRASSLRPDVASRLAKQQHVVPNFPFGSTTYTGDRLLWQQYFDNDKVGSATTPITYDGAGRLKAIPGIITDTLYNARGQTTTLSRANSVTTTYGWSAQRRWLTSIDTVAGSTIIQDLAYTRDAWAASNKSQAAGSARAGFTTTTTSTVWSRPTTPPTTASTRPSSTTPSAI